jgi:flagellar protein FliO/FliZ
MTAYIIKLVIMLPLMIGLIIACLWAWKKFQPGMAALPAFASFVALKRKRSLVMVDALTLGMAGRIAVVEFGGQHLLVGISRSGMTLLSQVPAPTFVLPEQAVTADD